MTQESSNDFVVMEKEFKSDRTHQDKVTGIVYINENEFLTSSLDSSLKLWDKHLQGTGYTFETHEPLHSMAVSGERGDLLVGGLGRGNFIVYGLTQKNQLHIFELAHGEPISQIVSLSKLQNKYFATRCVEGHVNIWSATNHPDRLFTLFYVDADEDALAPLQPPPKEPEPVVIIEKVKKFDEDGNEIIDEEEEEAAEEEKPKKKKKPEPVRPTPPTVLVGAPVCCEKDIMIELKWKGIIQSSSTMLCMSNYTEKLTIICNVDLKTRRRQLTWVVKNNRSPTALFQVDEDFIVVGTEGGKMEIWNIEQKKIVKFIDAHGDCNEGISSIVELKNPSYLIRGERKEADPNVRFVISAAFDKNEFKIWKLINRHDKFKRPEFTFHIKISTSLRGIRAVLASSPDQIVCVDNEKTLKFYNFIDKVAQQEEEKFQEQISKFQETIRPLYENIDLDRNGALDVFELQPLLTHFINQYESRHNVELDSDAKEKMKDDLFNEMDIDKSGTIDQLELKVFLTRKYDEMFRVQK